jgi:hypothetical protein
MFEKGSEQEMTLERAQSSDTTDFRIVLQNVAYALN